MSSTGGIFAPIALRVLRQAVSSTSKLVRERLSTAARQLGGELQPVTIRSTPAGRQPVHPAAFLRQQKRSGSNWFSTSSSSPTTTVQGIVRRFLSGSTRNRIDRSTLPVSRTSRAVSQFPGRAPFCSTLRPNLSGGTLPRTAGGYGIPGSGRLGGQRYFSHTPAAPAQVVQQVSQAARAFWTGGHRARFDGVTSDGKHQFRAVGTAQEAARIKMSGVPRGMPGSYIDFRISPTVTALSPLSAGFPFTMAGAQIESNSATLNADGLLDVLSVDFARALKDLSAVMADLKRLSSLGDLELVLQKDNVIRVRFPGVDAETVDRLCDDVGVQRGIVGQDVDFDDSIGVPMALRFPFAPDDNQDTISSPGGSLRTHGSEASTTEDQDLLDAFVDTPWLSSSDPEGYESMSPPIYSGVSEDFEGLEGIYRFLEECDRARTRF